MDTNRIFGPLLVLLVAAGAFFGLAPLFAPDFFSTTLGFEGRDLFVYRLAGAATLGYGVGLAVGWRASWSELRVPFIATLVFNVASIIACALAIADGEPQLVVYVILAASIVFSIATALCLRTPPLGATGAERSDLQHPMPGWLTALFGIGVAAAFVFGLAPLAFGGGFGTFLGYTGTDAFVYRQAGAATLGAAVGGVFVLLARTWTVARLPAVMALVFNGFSVMAAIIEIGSAGQPVAYVILAAAGLTTVGMAIALVRGGR